MLLVLFVTYASFNPKSILALGEQLVLVNRQALNIVSLDFKACLLTLGRQTKILRKKWVSRGKTAAVDSQYYLCITIRLRSTDVSLTVQCSLFRATSIQ